MKQFQIKFWINSEQKKVLDIAIRINQQPQGEYIKTKLFRTTDLSKPENYQLKELEEEKMKLETEIQTLNLKIQTLTQKIKQKQLIYSTKFQDIFFKLCKNFKALGEFKPNSAMFNPQAFISKSFDPWEISRIEEISKNRDYLMRDLP